MATKGLSGQQIAEKNIILVEQWIKERNVHRDWDDYAYNNRINRSTLSRELDFAKSVCTQNKKVRKLIEGAERVWFKAEVVDKAAHAAARERAENHAGAVSMTNSKLLARITELEAENKELKKKLSAFKVQKDLLLAGKNGFLV